MGKVVQFHHGEGLQVKLRIFASQRRQQIREITEGQFRVKSGLNSCPGGGAEIFREPTRSMICAHKCDADRWLELAGKVHAAGLKTNATMLYGHIESIEDR